jgi:hypothetical protein
MTRTANPVRSHIPVEDFDPNASLGSVKFWLTYTGSLKLRTTRGPAITDFNRSVRAKLYEWDPALNSWRLLADKSRPHAPVCDLCGGSTFGHPWHYRWANGTYEWVPDTSQPLADLGRHVFLRHNRKLLDPLRLVYACRECCEGRGL